MYFLLQIDVLVNNAGRSQRAVWENIEIQVDREILELNVLSVVSLTRLVLPHMLERKQGHIVNMSSLAGKLGMKVIQLAFCFSSVILLVAYIAVYALNVIRKIMPRKLH